jgi:hypothetical protein
LRVRDVDPARDRPQTATVTSAASQLPRQRNGLGIAYRVMAMACMACLSAIVKWTGERGVPVFEIILFRNLFAFAPLGLYIWRTTGFSASSAWSAASPPCNTCRSPRPPPSTSPRPCS